MATCAACPAVRQVGILNYAADDDTRVRQFRAALRELGYIEEKNVAITIRSAGGALDQLAALAEKLVADKVNVIVALGPAVWAAKRATTAIPIIIAFSGTRWEMGSYQALRDRAAT